MQATCVCWCVKKKTIDAKNNVSSDVPDTDNNNTLLSLQTKVDEVEDSGNVVMYELLNAPPLMRWTTINNESAISSNLTMDTQMEAVESNIGNLDNYVNHMTHMLTKFMHELKQSSKIAPPANPGIGVDINIPTANNDSIKVTENLSISGQQKWAHYLRVSQTVVVPLTSKVKREKMRDLRLWIIGVIWLPNTRWYV